MTLPQHKNPTTEERTARAPYNFVPLPERVVTAEELPPRDRYDPDLYTGTIHCTLSTETPLYTRAALEPGEYGHREAKDKPEFFYVDPATKSPVIPGSTLRGMLRTLVEIVGHGKMYAVASTPLVYRAVGDTTSLGLTYRNRLMREDERNYYTPLVQAGYMERHKGQLSDHDGEWIIRPAQDVDGTTFARISITRIPSGLKPVRNCCNAWRLWVEPGPYEYQTVRGGFIHIKYSRVHDASAQPGSDLIEGTLARSGRMFSKTKEAVVFPLDRNAKPIPVPDDLVDAYRQQISPEQETLLGREGVLNEGQPVFYLMERGSGAARGRRTLVFFGHTMMMRMVYPYSPLDFVPPALRRPEDIDLAEAIFGRVEEKHTATTTIAGRAFVSDARLSDEIDPEDAWLSDSPMTPRILSGPKPTTFQHYLTQQTPDPIDVGRKTKSGRRRRDVRLQDYASRPGRDAVIRGHKLYWHKGAADISDIQETPRKLAELAEADDKQHTRIRPVKSGATFRFEIAFENLRSVELGALLWVLTLPGEPNKTYRHRLGMGKPLGMGSVKLDPTLHLSTRRRRYASLFSETGWTEADRAATTQEIDDLVTHFDAYVREQTVQLSHDALGKIERIQMLLRMLEWRGPDLEETRYMEIERPDPSAKRGKRNEYRGRPVLPDPIAVVEASPPIRVERPISPQVPAPIVEATVVRLEGSYVVIDVEGEKVNLQFNHLPDPGYDQDDRRDLYPAGKKLRVEKLGRSQRGKLRVTAKDVRQEE